MPPATERFPFLPRLLAGTIASSIAFIAILITVWAQWGPLPSMSFFGDEWLRDQFIQRQVSLAKEPRILVVDIDESSTAELGKWPWSRERIAELVEILLTQYQAKGVALDI